jgi:hypothetical protein
MAYIVVLRSARHPEHPPTEWNLNLQWGEYNYPEEPGRPPQKGYRYIWIRRDGSLAAQRGQARIPSKADADLLWAIAEREGWANERAEDATDLTVAEATERPIGHKTVTVNGTTIEVPIYPSDVAAAFDARADALERQG